MVFAYSPIRVLFELQIQPISDFRISGFVLLVNGKIIDEEHYIIVTKWQMNDDFLLSL